MLACFCFIILRVKFSEETLSTLQHQHELMQGCWSFLPPSTGWYIQGIWDSYFQMSLAGHYSSHWLSLYGNWHLHNIVGCESKISTSAKTFLHFTFGNQKLEYWNNTGGTNCPSDCLLEPWFTPLCISKQGKAEHVWTGCFLPAQWLLSHSVVEYFMIAARLNTYLKYLLVWQRRFFSTQISSLCCRS